ncbi:MAG TPA: sigma-70 family RNA polymerase sigma factor [Blastocatellia bacterium]|nr:sigma-70 family RNA polymerase sigma factor [Blastocatellia bacterium]
MPGEVADIALMTDSPGLGDSSPNALSYLAPVIERAKAGDMAAFEQIIEHHQRRVITTAWRMLGNSEDARDAAQEVFLRVYKYLRGFRSDQDFAAWLYRIVINVCRDHARTRSRYAGFASFESEQERGSFDSLASTGNVESEMIQAQQRAMLDQALDTLSKKERAAIVLRDLEGMSTEKVAEVLGSSQTTVRSQISSARAKIKKYRERVLKQTRRME